jgi:hypothetical protein
MKQFDIPTGMSGGIVYCLYCIGMSGEMRGRQCITPYERLYWSMMYLGHVSLIGICRSDSLMTAERRGSLSSSACEGACESGGATLRGASA